MTRTGPTAEKNRQNSVTVNTSIGPFTETKAERPGPKEKLIVCVNVVENTGRYQADKVSFVIGYWQKMHYRLRWNIYTAWFIRQVNRFNKNKGKKWKKPRERKSERKMDRLRVKRSKGT